MSFLKKYIKKLYHLIWFLSIFIIFLLPVSAETVDMTFSNFRTYAQSYGITYNSEIYSTLQSVDINMSAVPDGSPFEWITNYTNKCSGTTIITGRFRFDGNPNLTYDFLNDNIKEIYYAPNISGVISTPCSWSVNPNNLQVSFTCSTNQPNNNFIVGGRWRYRTGSFSAQYLVFRNMNITCDNSASAIIDNNTQNTQDIINNNNNNTNNIINNNNQNSQDIINSSGSNTQSIIDNQNENSNKEIESQKVCKIKNIDKNNIEIDNKYLANNGSLVDNNIVGVTSYIKLNSSSTLTIIKANSATSCFYDENKTLISCFITSSTGLVSIPQNANYFRATIQKGNNSPTFSLNYCINGNQAIDDTLSDSSVDSSDSTINNLKNQIPTNSVISDLLLLPVRFLQNFINALGSSCSTFSLGSLYGTELFMPCINIEHYLGSGIWTTIDLIISGLFVYRLRKKFIEIYENLTNLKNGGNEVD